MNWSLDIFLKLPRAAAHQPELYVCSKIHSSHTSLRQVHRNLVFYVVLEANKQKPSKQTTFLTEGTCTGTGTLHKWFSVTTTQPEPRRTLHGRHTKHDYHRVTRSSLWLRLHADISLTHSEGLTSHNGAAEWEWVTFPQVQSGAVRFLLLNERLEAVQTVTDK